MRTVFDAVVVGAGPAGSSAAILLSRAGWSVALVEKELFPRRKVCGECIAASNLPLLEALGIGSAFDAVAGPALRKVALLRANLSIEAELPPATDENYRWGRALGRETLDTLLLEQARATGAEVLQPWSVQTLDGAPGDWRCGIRSMESGVTSILRSSVAIDAHGSWEALPWARRNRHRTDGAADLLAFKANFRGASVDEGLLPVFSLRGGYGGMVVADADVTTVACCVRRDRLAACRLASPGLRAGEAIEAFLRRECAGVRIALQTATREGSWLAAGPLRPGIRVDAGNGSFRIGNAAGEAHPIIGEGMSMAMQSAWLLCTQLLDGGRRGNRSADAVQRDVGRRYAEAWRRAFESRLQLAAAFAHAAMHPASAASLVVLARAWPGLLTLGARLAGKTRSVADPAPIGSRHPFERNLPGVLAMNTTLDRLRALLVKDYKLEPDRLTPDVPLEALGIDSLGVAELMFNIEDEFEVAIPGDPGALATVGDVVRYIDGLVTTQHPATASGAGAADLAVPAL